MKALIFNSGLGKRMGEMTKDRPKSMVQLKTGETIFERQIRLLEKSGITEFIVTTGPYPEKLKEVASKHLNSRFTFISNPLYDKTNCIYSFYLASDYLDDDFITLHGDLVFSERTLNHILADPHSSCVSVDHSKPLPEKDFKCRIKDGKVVCISVKIFGDDCAALQPMYKISKADMSKWIASVKEFINEEHCDVYAEEAFNAISSDFLLYPTECEGYYVEEIDNKEDYDRVSAEIALLDVKEQAVLRDLVSFENYLKDNGFTRPLVVGSKRIGNLPLMDVIRNNSSPVFFSEFSPNPQYAEAVEGRKAFFECNCNSLISIGGGSAMDTAKCILAFSKINNEDYLRGIREYRFIPHIAIPTTAGTGSESTRYATLYRDGKKYSVAGEDEIPQAIVLIPELLKTMPNPVKTATLLDAMCQCIESLWSVNATKESRLYASNGINLILRNTDKYYLNEDEAIEKIQLAANYSGRAINISQTTAAHAMSYVLTSELGIPHGIAVTYCILPLWKSMITSDKGEQCEEALTNIDRIFDEKSHDSTFNKFTEWVSAVVKLEKIHLTEKQCIMFTKSVNVQRLSNYPLKLTENDICNIYRMI